MRQEEGETGGGELLWMDRIALDQSFRQIASWLRQLPKHPGQGSISINIRSNSILFSAKSADIFTK